MGHASNVFKWTKDIRSQVNGRSKYPVIERELSFSVRGVPDKSGHGGANLFGGTANETGEIFNVEVFEGEEFRVHLEDFVNRK